jgi:Mg2+ and Co2+ transporter CorA
VKIGGGKRQVGQSMGKMRLTVDAGDRGWQDNVDLAQLGELRHDRETLLWLDITDPGPAEIDLLRREFDFHELALEDVAKLEFHQRPRCDRYEGYYFIVLYAAERSADTYAPRELQMFWGERFLITIHNGDLAIVSQARGRWLRHDGRQHHSVAYMAYALCDALVDGYFPVQDWLEDRVEAIEEAVLTGEGGYADRSVPAPQGAVARTTPFVPDRRRDRRGDPSRAVTHTGVAGAVSRRHARSPVARAGRA